MSVTWEGQLRVVESGTQRFYLRSTGSAVTLAVGGRDVTPAASALGEWRGAVPLEAGFHRIIVSASFPQGSVRSVEVGRVIAGREEPLDGRVVFRESASAWRLTVDRAARAIGAGFDLLLAASLLLALWAALRDSCDRLRLSFNARDAMAMVWALGIADALIFALPVLGRLVVLSGGDDWLTYETMARDIALNGPWMAGGAALGHGRPFYYQPLYPYFLAAVHRFTGDGLFGIYFAQRLLVVATLVATWRTTAVLFDETVGLAGLLAAIVIAYTKFAAWSGFLLTETLLSAGLHLGVPARAARPRRARRLARGGADRIGRGSRHADALDAGSRLGAGAAGAVFRHRRRGTPARRAADGDGGRHDRRGVAGDAAQLGGRERVRTDCVERVGQSVHRQ